MVTTLGIVLAVLIVLNVWFSAYAVKRERKRRKRLQERMDEYDEFVGNHLNEMGVLKQRLNETLSQLSHTKKALLDLRVEMESCKDGAPVDSDAKPAEPKLRKVNLAALDLQDLQKTYNELAKRYENPSKTYLVRNIVKVYDVKSRTALAKVLGVSQQSINQMLRKK